MNAMEFIGYTIGGILGICALLAVRIAWLTYKSDRPGQVYHTNEDDDDVYNGQG